MRAMALAVLAGDPQHVADALGIGETRRHKKEIGKAVDVAQRLRIEAFTLIEVDEISLCPAGDGPAEMQRSGKAAAAGQDERGQIRKRAIEVVDLAFKPRNMAVADPEALARTGLVERHGEVGAEVEQVVLD